VASTVFIHEIVVEVVYVVFGSLYIFIHPLGCSNTSAKRYLQLNYGVRSDLRSTVPCFFYLFSVFFHQTYFVVNPAACDGFLTIANVYTFYNTSMSVFLSVQMIQKLAC
jgi:hypothetical protein